MKSPFKRILTILYYTIMTSIAVCFVSIIYNKIRFPDSPPTLFNYQLYVDVTNSMLPDLHANDIIVVKRVPQDKLHEGDIITFREHDTTVTHRIINVIQADGETKYQTKGDNNNLADDRLIVYSEIEGKYLFRIRHLGFLITDKVSFILMVVIVAIIIFFPYKKLFSSTQSDNKPSDQQEPE